MELIGLIIFAVRRRIPIAFLKARNRANYPFRRPSNSSWSSISRLPRPSASRCLCISSNLLTSLLSEHEHETARVHASWRRRRSVAVGHGGGAVAQAGDRVSRRRVG